MWNRTLDAASLFEALGDAVVIANADASVVYANAAFERLLGWSRHDLVEKSLGSLFHKRVRDEHEHELRRFLDDPAGPSERTIRVSVRHRDGSEIEVELRLAFVPGREDRLVVATLRDLRTRLELERRLAATRYLRAATQLAGKISGRHDMDQAMRLAVETIGTDLEAALAAIWIADDSGLVLRATHQLVDPALFGSTVDTIVRTRTPFVTNEIHRLPGAESWRMSATAGFPLVMRDELLGVLVTTHDRRVEPELFEALGTISALLAAAINDARLLRKRQNLVARLQTERTHFHSLLMQAPAAIAILRGPDHMLELSNPMQTAIFGRDATGEAFATAFPEIAAQGYVELLDRVRTTDQPYRATEAKTTVTTADGRPRDIYTNVVYEPMHGSSGDVDGVMMFGFDVTEGVLMRQQLLRAGERTARLQAVTARLAAAVTREEVAAVSVEAGAAAIDAARGELWLVDGDAPRLAHAFGSPAIGEACASTIARCLEIHEPQWLEDPAALAAMGLPPPFRVACIPLQIERRSVGALVFGFDSVEPFDAEARAIMEVIARLCAQSDERCRSYEAVSEALRIREDFLAVAGHELRTPLAALLLQVESMQAAMKRGPVAQERVQDRLGKMERHAERLRLLIGQLLDVSRLVAGRMLLSREPCNLAEIVREVVERFSTQLAASGSRIKLAIEDPIPGVWDRFRVDQIITNLLANAIKYGAGQPIEVVARRDGGWAVFSVRDRGIGIAPEDQERVFGRFERAVSSRNYGGLGLGLWIVRQVVEEHGGTIKLHSIQGEGSELQFELPAGDP